MPSAAGRCTFPRATLVLGALWRIKVERSCAPARPAAASVVHETKGEPYEAFSDRRRSRRHARSRSVRQQQELVDRHNGRAIVEHNGRAIVGYHGRAIVGYYGRAIVGHHGCARRRRRQHPKVR